MHTEVYWQIIYWSSTPILALLVGIFIRRRLFRQFPFFFIYLVVACLRECALICTYNRSALSYFYTYWISHLVSAIFIFLATCELFGRRLFPRFYKTTFYRYFFSVAALATIAVGVSAVLGGLRLSILGDVINTLNFLRIVVLLFSVALMILMGRRWHKYEFGIALGLSVNAAAFVITFAVFLKSGLLHGLLRELPAVAGDAVSLIWLITFLHPEKSSIPLKAPASTEVVQQAKAWEQGLKESLTGSGKT